MVGWHIESSIFRCTGLDGAIFPLGMLGWAVWNAAQGLPWEIVGSNPTPGMPFI